MSARLLLIAVFLFFGAAAGAQELLLPVKQLGVSEGLPQNSIYSLYQDSRGFIWIGTGDGLARWDGRSFRTFRGRYNDTSGRSLSARMVRGRMAEDRQGRLWFSTNNGLVFYDMRRQRFHQVPAPGGDPERIELAGITSSGAVVVANGRSIWLIDSQIQTLALSLAPDERLGEAVLSDTVLHFHTNRGLYAYSLKNKRQQLLLRQDSIQRFFKADGDLIHVWLPEGLLVLGDGSIKQRLPLPAALQEGFHPMLHSGGMVYYGMARSGLMRSDVATGFVEHFPTGGDPKHSLSTNLLLRLMMDRSQNLWVGTEGGGINIIDTKGFKFHTYIPERSAGGKQPELMVKSLLDVGGKLWIGTFSLGLFELDLATRSIQNWPPASGMTQRISLLQRDSSGRVWMNYEERVGIIDTVTKQFRTSVIIPDNALGNIAALALCELKRNHFLLGSIHGTHYVRATGNEQLSIRPFKARHPALSGQITAIAKHPDGSIFIGKVRDGFYRIRAYPEKDSFIMLDHGFHQTGIRHFLFSGDGRFVWMATENGLLLYEAAARRYRMLDEHDGLSNSHIYGIVPEGDSVLWLSTNRGLNRVKYRLDATGLQLLGVTPFTVQDGLQSNEFNTGAFCRTRDGAMAFGGVVGVNWFYPQRFFTNPYPPLLAITGISVNEKPLQSDIDVAYLSSITLPYFSNTLAISFAALEYTNPDANRCQYMLEGFDAGWVDAGESRVARYANLPPGNYSFLVRAANSDGVWSQAPLRLQVHITPPWWQRLWARLLAVAVLLAVIVFAIRIIIRRRVAEKLRELEKQQAVNEERLRISRDMHDELGTGLTKIALLSEVARRKASTMPQPASLQEIASTSRQLTQKIGEIVWTLNPQNDTLDTLASYIREYLQEQYDSLEDVFVTTDFPETFPPMPLSHAVRQAVLLVTKEAVNNAVKYAAASQIVVSIRLTEAEIEFSVTDNGAGFVMPSEIRTGRGRGNGLGNMAARMAAAGGRLDIKTAPGQGTVVSYAIPHTRG